MGKVAEANSDGGRRMIDLISAVRRTASEVDPYEPTCAARLLSLAEAIQPDGDATSWAGVDMPSVLDPASVGDAVRDATERNRELALSEIVRNVLAVIPIMLTWLGLMYAAIGYKAAVDADPGLVDQPFILLWENDFNNHAPGILGDLAPILRLSHIAMGDAAILAVIIGLTIRIHTDRNFRQARRENIAREIERKLRHIIWFASAEISRRTSLPAVAERFRVVAERLIDEIAAERQRIQDLAAQRDREVVDLRTFVHDWIDLESNPFSAGVPHRDWMSKEHGF